MRSVGIGSESTTWQDAVAAFRSRGGGGAWNLPRARVADDLEAAIRAPDSINQGAFGFCGIAAFLRFWIRRYPHAFAIFATSVYENGAASFTSYKVDPNSHLRSVDYLTAFAAGGTRCPPGQWMVMSAIQDSISPAGFDGTVDRSWHAFLSLHEGAIPTQIAKLLEDTHRYSKVENRTDWPSLLLPRVPFLPDPWRPTVGDAKSLDPGRTCDIVLQVNDVVLHGASPIPPGLLRDIRDDFPNHFIALESRPTLVDDALRCRVWTWAGFQDLDMPVDRFMCNYYGAIVCTV
jgi:hypothetical protein